MSRTTAFDADLRQRLVTGALMVARAVGTTLGPRGRTVMIERRDRGRAPVVTKDGATVARSVTPADRWERIGAYALRRVIRQQADEAGDGTTTVTVLAGYLLREGHRLITAGYEPFQLARHMTAMATEIERALMADATPLRTSEQIFAIARQAMNGDPLAVELARCIEAVGKDGTIRVREGQGVVSSFQVTEGVSWEKGAMSPLFLDPSMAGRCELRDAAILLTDITIESHEDLLPLAEEAAAAGRSLLIVAGGVVPDARPFFVVNARSGALPNCIVSAPGFGAHREQALMDFALCTGATAILAGRGLPLADVRLSHCGRTGRVVVTKDRTVLEQPGAPIAARARLVQQLRAGMRELEGADLDRARARLSSIVGASAEFTIGGVTETALRETRARLEDAINACRGASEWGTVPGGGQALLSAADQAWQVSISRWDEPDEPGRRIVRDACAEPMRQLSRNAGWESGWRVEEATRLGCGIDLWSGEPADMRAFGVWEPAKVPILALRLATSLAAQLLTCDAGVLT